MSLRVVGEGVAAPAFTQIFSAGSSEGFAQAPFFLAAVISLLSLLVRQCAASLPSKVTRGYFCNGYFCNMSLMLDLTLAFHCAFLWVDVTKEVVNMRASCKRSSPISNRIFMTHITRTAGKFPRGPCVLNMTKNACILEVVRTPGVTVVRSFQILYTWAYLGCAAQSAHRQLFSELGCSSMPERYSSSLQIAHHSSKSQVRVVNVHQVTVAGIFVLHNKH